MIGYKGLGARIAIGIPHDDPARAVVVADVAAQLDPGMLLGLGSGRAVWALIDELKVRWAGGLPRVVVASSATDGRAAAAQLAAEGGDTLRVAVRSAEAPERLLADAGLVVDGPPGLRDFLERLTARPGSS